MDEVCRQIASAVSATSVCWRTVDDRTTVNVSALVTAESGRSADVVIPVTEHPRYAIEISNVTHGRRLLSGDVSMLSSVGRIAARRVNSLRLASERIARETHDREVGQLLAENRLRVHIDVPPDCRAVGLPALLIQPLVENAIKHGITPSVAGGQIVIAARITADSGQRALRITVTDSATIPTLNRGARPPWLRGVGLTSVERRLMWHYGSRAMLRIDAESPVATVVELTIPLPAQADALADKTAG
jgi:two-component sensor histidine kinase